MPKKRSHNQGSIRKRPDGIWEARFSVGVDITGKQIQRSLYGGTRTEVAVKLAQELEKVNSGRYIDESDMQVKDFLPDWLSRKKTKIKPTTYDSYEQHIRIHILPVIGDKKLKDIKRKHIQEYYDLLYETGRADKKGGLSSASIVKVHNILHSAFEYAVNNQMISVNPTKDVAIPRTMEKERRVLTLEEQKAFIKALEGDRLQAAFLLDISTGMRLGELLALTWDDINLSQKYLIVRRTLARIKNRYTKDEKYKLVPQEPKTEKAKRLIPIPDSIVPVLMQHKDQQEKEKADAGDLYEDKNIVFSTDTGRYIHPRNFMRSFYRIVEKAGIPRANVHSLRHTFATRMLELGESAKVVQELLGHKNITQTLNTYTHVLEDTKKSAMSKIDLLMQAFNSKSDNHTNTVIDDKLPEN